MKVAHTGLGVEESVENIMSAVQVLCQSLPGGANNIRNMHIKTSDSPALPVYMSEGNCYSLLLKSSFHSAMVSLHFIVIAVPIRPEVAPKHVIGQIKIFLRCARFQAGRRKFDTMIYNRDAS